MKNIEKEFHFKEKLRGNNLSKKDKEKVFQELAKLHAKNNRVFDDPFFIIIVILIVLAAAFFFSDGFSFIWM